MTAKWQYKEAYEAALAKARDLEAKNAKLRVERDEWHRVAESKQFIIDHMRNANADNAKLRELCGELLRMAESNDPDFLHWPEIHDELRKLGVEVDG